MARSGPYHSLEEFTGRKVRFSEILQELSAIPRRDVIRWVVGLSERLERIGADEPPTQIDFLRQLLPKGFWVELDAQLKNRDAPIGCFFHRRQLWFVLQMALLACKDDEPKISEDEIRQTFGLCCLMANDLLMQIERVPELDPEFAKHSLSFAMTTLIAYTELSYGHEVFARANLFWLEIPEEPVVRKKAKELGITRTPNEAFSAKYGVSLREFMLYTTVMYFKMAEALLQEQPSALMWNSTQAFKGYFSEEHVQKILRLISSPPDVLAARLLGSPRQSWAIDSTVLVRTPLIQLSENDYACPDLHMLRAVFIHGIFERLLRAFPAKEFKQLFGTIFEQYIKRLMESFAPTHDHLATTSFFSPVHFVGEKDEEACDGLLLWSDVGVLLECKTGLLTTRQRYALSYDETTKAIDDQLATFEKGKRKGIGQLAHSLYRILKGAQVHCKGKTIELMAMFRLYPAVVIYDEGMANHAVRVHLNNRMTEWFAEMKLDHSKIGHALLFSIRDMEYCEILADRIGTEKLMKDYAAYVEANPLDLHSMFSEYALRTYPEAKECTGYTFATIGRVIHEVQTEMARRKAMITPGSQHDS